MGAPILGLRCSDMAVISSYYIVLRYRTPIAVNDKMRSD